MTNPTNTAYVIKNHFNEYMLYFNEKNYNFEWTSVPEKAFLIGSFGEACEILYFRDKINPNLKPQHLRIYVREYPNTFTEKLV